MRLRTFHLNIQLRMCVRNRYQPEIDINSSQFKPTFTEYKYKIQADIRVTGSVLKPVEVPRSYQTLHVFFSIHVLSVRRT